MWACGLTLTHVEHYVDDIAASEDILGEIILYKTLSGNIFVYFIMSALYFL